MTLEARIRLTLGLLDLDVELGATADEVVAILGPNGAGKTTILRALAGLQPIDDGRVVLDGVVLDGVVVDGLALDGVVVELGVRPGVVTSVQGVVDA